MQAFANYQLLVLFITSAVASILAMWVFGLTLSSRRNRRAMGKISPASGPPVLTFEGEVLASSTASAGEFIPGIDKEDYSLDDLVCALSPRFPDIADALEYLPERRFTSITANDGMGRALLSWKDGLTSVKLDNDDNLPAAAGIDPKTVHALEEELETLRATAQFAPFLVWRQDKDGKINWANNAYIDLVSMLDELGTTAVWPPKRIFDDVENCDVPQSGTHSERISVALPGALDPQWFVRHVARLGTDLLHMAAPIDEAVRVGLPDDDVEQTLTKTFVHLTVGLAIFDKNRKLALFNPALSDLTTLKPDFLMVQPTLQAFLNKLRDKRMIPEPRDYRSWRQRMYELESAAKHGLYEETWPLPSGQTFHVTGRPHPDGALAFIFEDKSAEVSLTRRFRSQIQAGQAVLDSLDEAIAVFSASGTLTMTNQAYCTLWNEEPDTSLTAVSIVDATRNWSQACAPTPIWGDLRDYVGGLEERSAWSGEVRLDDGRAFICRAVPLAGGATLVGFAQSGLKRTSVDETSLKPQMARPKSSTEKATA